MSDTNNITYSAMCRIAKELLYKYAGHVSSQKQAEGSVGFYRDKAETDLAEIHSLIGMGFPITQEHLKVAREGINSLFLALDSGEKNHFKGL